MTGVAVKVTGLPKQKGLEEAMMETLTGRRGRTDTGNWMLDAGLVEVHVPDDKRMQDTRSPLVGTKEKFGEFVPPIEPLTFHWYWGEVPPLTGMAVKVTCVPEQTGLAEGETATLTGRIGLTAIVMEFEVAGLLEVHTVFDEVKTH